MPIRDIPPTPAFLGGLIRLALSSPARTAILQPQDLLGLGSEARTSTPGQAGGCWEWQLAPGELTPAHAARLFEATVAPGRLSPAPRVSVAHALRLSAA
jgi:4-alpha-glucanotransferase